MKRVIIVHGWEASPEGGWRPWLRKELEDRGFEVHVPAMPDTNNPKIKELFDKTSVPKRFHMSSPYSNNSQ